jgi:5'-3' exonuclease
LEADDALGIYATKEPGHIICSPDKDMRQIPGDLYDLTQMKWLTVEPEEWPIGGTSFKLLAGDQTDGYAGVPGIGIKRAVALFEKANGATLGIQ